MQWGVTDCLHVEEFGFCENRRVSSRRRDLEEEEGYGSI